MGGGTADSKIFESARDFRIESNLEASQVALRTLVVSLVIIYKCYISVEHV